MIRQNLRPEVQSLTFHVIVIAVCMTSILLRCRLSEPANSSNRLVVLFHVLIHRLGLPDSLRPAVIDSWILDSRWRNRPIRRR